MLGRAKAASSKAEESHETNTGESPNTEEPPPPPKAAPAGMRKTDLGLGKKIHSWKKEKRKASRRLGEDLRESMLPPEGRGRGKKLFNSLADQIEAWLINERGRWGARSNLQERAVRKRREDAVRKEKVDRIVLRGATNGSEKQNKNRDPQEKVGETQVPRAHGLGNFSTL